MYNWKYEPVVVVVLIGQVFSCLLNMKKCKD